MSLVEHELEIQAPVQRVYELLTTAQGLLQWIAVDALVEPRPGGRVRWTHENGDTMIGRFVELDPPHRLVFTYGWADGQMGLPPESSTVEITLDEQEGVTLLRLRHSGLPQDATGRHRDGWIWFLGCLGDVAAGRAAGAG